MVSGGCGVVAVIVEMAVVFYAVSAAPDFVPTRL